MTILTFMNVDGAFILAETLRKTSVLLFKCRYFSDISHYEFGKMFVTRITLSHAFKNNNKNEQMMNNCFSAEFPRTLGFEPWRHELVQRCLNTCNSCMF